MKKIILVIVALLALMLFLPAWISYPESKPQVPQLNIKEAYLCDVQGYDWTKRIGSSYLYGEIVFANIIYENPTVSEDEKGKHIWITWSARVVDQNGKVYFDRELLDEKYYLDPEKEQTTFIVYYMLDPSHPMIDLPLGDYTIIYHAKDNYSGLEDTIKLSFSIVLPRQEV